MPQSGNERMTVNEQLYLLIMLEGHAAYRQGERHYFR
jgi:hypothetical protein